MNTTRSGDVTIARFDYVLKETRNCYAKISFFEEELAKLYLRREAISEEFESLRNVFCLNQEQTHG